MALTLSPESVPGLQAGSHPAEGPAVGGGGSARLPRPLLKPPIFWSLSCPLCRPPWAQPSIHHVDPAPPSHGWVGVTPWGWGPILGLPQPPGRPGRAGLHWVPTWLQGGRAQTGGHTFGRRQQGGSDPHVGPQAPRLPLSPKACSVLEDDGEDPVPGDLGLGRSVPCRAIAPSCLVGLPKAVLLPAPDTEEAGAGPAPSMAPIAASPAHLCSGHRPGLLPGAGPCPPGSPRHLPLQTRLWGVEEGAMWHSPTGHQAGHRVPSPSDVEGLRAA